MPDPASYGIKTFVNGKALYRSFDHMKTYIDGSISSAITAHNADAAHRHLPSVPTTNPPTNAFSYLTNSSTPAWGTMPTETGYANSSNGTLATAGAVKAAYDTLNTNLTNLRKIRTYRTTFTLDSSGNGSKTISGVMPIDCGLVNMSWRSNAWGSSAGGCGCCCAGYFFSSTFGGTSHNDGGTISLSGHVSNTTINICNDTGAANKQVAVTLTWIDTNYNTATN